MWEKCKIQSKFTTHSGFRFLVAGPVSGGSLVFRDCWDKGFGSPRFTHCIFSPHFSIRVLRRFTLLNCNSDEISGGSGIAQNRPKSRKICLKSDAESVGVQGGFQRGVGVPPSEVELRIRIRSESHEIRVKSAPRVPVLSPAPLQYQQFNVVHRQNWRNATNPRSESTKCVKCPHFSIQRICQLPSPSQGGAKSCRENASAGEK